jgi:ceramide glucosyltransferase
MRTLRVLQPLSYRFLFLTFSVPLAIAGVFFTFDEPTLRAAAWTLFAITLYGRVAVHVSRGRDGRPAIFTDLWLLPARDLLTCWVWLRSSFTSRIRWRGSDFAVGADGLLRRLP